MESDRVYRIMTRWGCFVRVLNGRAGRGSSLPLCMGRGGEPERSTSENECVYTCVFTWPLFSFHSHTSVQSSLNNSA